MKNLALTIAFICLAALVVGSGIVLTSNFGWLGLAAFLGALIVGWLVATWYFRDDEPALGPASPARVTFLAVVQDALRDLRTLVSPLEALGRRAFEAWVNATNALGGAIIALDIYIAQTPELKLAITETQYGLPILLALNFFAYVVPRLGRQAAA